MRGDDFDMSMSIQSLSLYRNVGIGALSLIYRHAVCLSVAFLQAPSDWQLRAGLCD